MNKQQLIKGLSKGTIATATVSALTVGSVALSNQNTTLDQATRVVEQGKDEITRIVTTRGELLTKSIADGIQEGLSGLVPEEIGNFEQVKKEVDRLQEQHEALKKDLHETKNRKVGLDEQTAKSIEEMGTKLESLEQQVNVLNDMPEMMGNNGQEINKLTKSVSSLSGLISNNGEKITKLTESIDDVTGSISTLKDRIGRQGRDLDSNQSQINRNQLAISDIHNKIADLIKSASALRNQVRGQEEGYEELDQRIKVLEDLPKWFATNGERISDLEEKVEQQARDLESNQEEIYTNQKTIKGVDDKFQGLTEIVKKYGIELESVKNKAQYYWSNFTERLGTFANELQDIREEIVEKGDEIEQLKEGHGNIWKNLYDHFAEFANFKKQQQPKLKITVTHPGS